MVWEQVVSAGLSYQKTISLSAKALKLLLLEKTTAK
jgi:hypothetical protein